MSIPGEYHVSDCHRLVPAFPMSKHRLMGLLLHRVMLEDKQYSPWSAIPIYWNKPHDPFSIRMGWISVDETDPHGSMAVHLHAVPLLKSLKSLEPLQDLWPLVFAMGELVRLHTDAFLVEEIHRL